MSEKLHVVHAPEDADLVGHVVDFLAAAFPTCRLTCSSFAGYRSEEDALQNADAVVAVVSRGALLAATVPYELGVARCLGKPAIVVVDDTADPTRLVLPLTADHVALAETHGSLVAVGRRLAASLGVPFGLSSAEPQGMLTPEPTTRPSSLSLHRKLLSDPTGLPEESSGVRAANDLTHLMRQEGGQEACEQSGSEITPLPPPQPVGELQAALPDDSADDAGAGHADRESANRFKPPPEEELTPAGVSSVQVSPEPRSPQDEDSTPRVRPSQPGKNTGTDAGWGESDLVTRPAGDASGPEDEITVVAPIDTKRLQDDMGADPARMLSTAAPSRGQETEAPATPPQGPAESDTQTTDDDPLQAPETTGVQSIPLPRPLPMAVPEPSATQVPQPAQTPPDAASASAPGAVPPGCQNSLDAGIAAATSSVLREQRPLTASDVAPAFATMLAGLGVKRVRLRTPMPPENWLQLARDTFVQRVPPATATQAWYELGFQLSTLLHLAASTGEDDEASAVQDPKGDRHGVPDPWQTAMDQLLRRARTLQWSATDTAVVEGMLENMRGQTAETDASGASDMMDRVRAVVRGVAAEADVQPETAPPIAPVLD